MTPERHVIQFMVSDKVAARLAQEAHAAGRPTNLHAKLMFEAAYAVRHGAADDPALAEAAEERLGPVWNRRPSPRPVREAGLVPALPPTLETAVQTGGGEPTKAKEPPPAPMPPAPQPAPPVAVIEAPTDAQIRTVRALRAAGHLPLGISRQTGLPVEIVRDVLSKPR